MMLNTPGSAILFNIFINDISYIIQETYICNFADYISLYSIEGNLTEVKTIFQNNFELLQVGFYLNDMVLNTEKGHYLIINKDITN